MGYFFEFQRVEDKVEHKIGMKALRSIENEHWDIRDKFGDSLCQSQELEIAEIIERETHVNELVAIVEKSLPLLKQKARIIAICGGGNALSGWNETHPDFIKQIESVLATFREDETK